MISSMNIAWWVQRWGELHPQKCAIIYEEERITYLELDRRANRTSCWLQSLGIEKGNRVAALLPNGPAFIELYLACSRLENLGWISLKGGSGTTAYGVFTDFRHFEIYLPLVLKPS